MRVVAAILAAGSGTRFGSDKTQLLLRGKPLWQYSFETYRSHPLVDDVGLVGSTVNLDALLAAGASFAVLGGSTRTESARAALRSAGDADILLLQDAARPFVSADVITSVIRATERSGAAAPGVPVADTIRRVEGTHSEPLDRTGLFAMQTPQGVRVDLMQRAYDEVSKEFTDDISLLETIGVVPEIVPGEVSNFKITTPEDVARANAHLGFPETRTGIGYDIHPFETAAHRPLMLGGVLFEGATGLKGHSDADVLLHAITDAVLGAASLGDIGKHFPPTDDQWKNRASIFFLQHAAALVRHAGWKIMNIDATVIAEQPKIMPRAEEIRTTIAKALDLDHSRVSVKATTNEGLGSLGRSEGIAAHAIATLTQTI